ncbi:hypothetical protein GCM10028793_28270 [Nocardiopsis oceani]
MTRAAETATIKRQETGQPAPNNKPRPHRAPPTRTPHPPPTRKAAHPKGRATKPPLCQQALGPMEELLSPPVGLVVLMVWTAAARTAGALALKRRDA